MKYEMSDTEVEAVIDALRHAQNTGAADTYTLTLEQIDDLCERLNVGEATAT